MPGSSATAPRSAKASIVARAQLPRTKAVSDPARAVEGAAELEVAGELVAVEFGARGEVAHDRHREAPALVEAALAVSSRGLDVALLALADAIESDRVGVGVELAAAGREIGPIAQARDRETEEAVGGDRAVESGGHPGGVEVEGVLLDAAALVAAGQPAGDEEPPGTLAAR